LDPVRPLVGVPIVARTVEQAVLVVLMFCGQVVVVVLVIVVIV